mmetsp:Transcript_59543/g.119522  ORF Transcript_59543/g.119522 Transcript_59543/m.119522 type:complete len:319 (+) Transcript_59543:153-1109(+)
MMARLLLLTLLPCATLAWCKFSPGKDFPDRTLAKALAKKKQKQQKKSGMAWALDFDVKPYESAKLRSMAELVCNSYRTITGNLLDPSLVSAMGLLLPKALWDAPVACIIVSEKETVSPEDENVGTKVLYANLAALESLGVTNGEADHSLVIGQDCSKLRLSLPGSMPAGGKKFESNYNKKLPKVKGTAPQDADSDNSISVLAAERWALEEASFVDGSLRMTPVGVVYAYRSWTQTESGVKCMPGGITSVAADTAQELIEAIEKQAFLVRNLKTTGVASGLASDGGGDGKGLPNSSPEVKVAVAELLRLKAELPPDMGG